MDRGVEPELCPEAGFLEPANRDVSLMEMVDENFGHCHNEAKVEDFFRYVYLFGSESFIFFYEFIHLIVSFDCFPPLVTSEISTEFYASRPFGQA
ncbi:hypothetical protein ACLOJK_000550 [Asimina triloba]